MAGPAAPARSSSARLAAALRRTGARVRYRVLPADGFFLLLAALFAAGVTVLSVVEQQWVPPAALALPVLAGGLILTVRSFVLLLIVVAAGLAYQLTRIGPENVRPTILAVLLPVAVLTAYLTWQRARLGLQGARGGAMLVDLRDRLRAQGELPGLPAGWQAEVEVRPAGGASFSGDFLVAGLSPDGRALEVVLVDVSGKGVGAGTRALLLSGAFGGLLGATPGEQFLPTANAYLLRQGWAEGFATAVHLQIDLVTGEFVATTAGHPPVAQFHATSGKWQVAGTAGPLLGVMWDAEYVGERGRLRPGDALLLYTDGLIEAPGQDITVGIDRLLGEAERLVPRGFRHGARRLVDAVGVGQSDDRAILLLWRT